MCVSEFAKSHQVNMACMSERRVICPRQLLVESRRVGAGLLRDAQLLSVACPTDDNSVTRSTRPEHFHSEGNSTPNPRHQQATTIQSTGAQLNHTSSIHTQQHTLTSTPQHPPPRARSPPQARRASPCPRPPPATGPAKSSARRREWPRERTPGHRDASKT